MAGDEDNGDEARGGGEFPLEFDSAQARQTDIEHETRGFRRRRVLEELSILMRSKRIGVFRERGSGAWKDRISAVVTGQKFRKVTCDSNYSNHQ